MKPNSVILKPVLTEKGTQLAQKSVYMFYVAQKARKAQVKSALEILYPVKIKKIRITIRKGKMRRTGKRFIYKQLPDKKIAYVTIKEGKLDLFPQS